MMKKIKALFAFLLIGLIAIFVLSNTQSVAIHFFSIKIQAPAAVIVLLSSVAGVALWPLMRAVLKSKT